MRDAEFRTRAMGRVEFRTLYGNPLSPKRVHEIRMKVVDFLKDAGAYHPGKHTIVWEPIQECGIITGAQVRVFRVRVCCMSSQHLCNPESSSWASKSRRMECWVREFSGEGDAPDVLQVARARP